ncbi:MAG: hypothetical protein JO261_11815 [Alphaproteobacteria bacterium]|nr:hypothetical protein [Alphaproteobacteria bacterium]MBV9694376.1 hypothetical protein [Alphaproteobacteria bacterium]
MKAAIAIAASVMLLGSVPAAAYHLIPESSDFTGTGKTSATKNGVSLPCKAKFTGHTDANGNGFVDSGTFSGQVGCSTVGLANLPWKGVVKSATKLVIQNVQFTSPIGDCGPGNLPVKLSNGVISFKNQPLPGGCVVSGKITTSPALSIVP